MNPPRFSLLALLFVVTLAAIAFAALANPTQLWASVVFSATLVLLGLAVVFAVARKGAARAGTIAFAIIGCAYMSVVSGSPTRKVDVMSYLLTHQLLDEAHAAWHPAESRRRNPNRYTSRNSMALLQNLSDFHHIGHCLFALVFAAGGGVLAKSLSTRESPRETSA